MNFKAICVFCILLTVVMMTAILCTAEKTSLPEQSPGKIFPENMIPQREPPEGIPPGDSNRASYTLAGVYSVDGETKTSDKEVFKSDTADMSAIYVTNGGTLTLTNPTIITSGNTSSNDASSFYGLNGAVLVNNGSTVSITGGSITTTGSGANGVIPTGEGTSVNLSDMTISATGSGGHGVMATLGASLTLNNVDISTTGRNGAPIATDRGSGTISVTGGTVTSSGTDSPGIYSTGEISITDATITSTGTEAAVIEGVNSITLTDTNLTGGVAKTGGVMIYQSFSGDADVGTGSFTMNGGSLTVPEGPVFFITNTDATINLTNVAISANSDMLIKSAATSRWGKEGSNGGHVTVTVDNQNLTGSLIAEEISTIIATLKNGTTLSGAVNATGLILDETSTWNVTEDSILTSLIDPSGISEDEITNIIGNGYTVQYDATLKDNSPLGGKSYHLSKGGELIPK